MYNSFISELGGLIFLIKVGYTLSSMVLENIWNKYSTKGVVNVKYFRYEFSRLWLNIAIIIYVAHSKCSSIWVLKYNCNLILINYEN